MVLQSTGRGRAAAAEPRDGGGQRGGPGRGRNAPPTWAGASRQRRLKLPAERKVAVGREPLDFPLRQGYGGLVAGVNKLRQGQDAQVLPYEAAERKAAGGGRQ